MLIFVDESGDSGLKISQGSSPYFTVVLVVFEDHDEATACEQRIFLLKKELGFAADFEFHFYANSQRIREAFCRAVLPYQFFYYGIVINKAKLFGEGFNNKESFYKYACGLLFENAKDKLNSAIVVIDESGRQLFKYQLGKYLKNKMNFSEGGKRIKKVKLQDSKSNNLLQLADMVAGAINRSFNFKAKDKGVYRKLLKSREMFVQFWPK